MHNEYKIIKSKYKKISQQNHAAGYLSEAEYMVVPTYMYSY